jgi:putative DNA primase/helicase
MHRAAGPASAVFDRGAQEADLRDGKDCFTANSAGCDRHDADAASDFVLAPDLAEKFRNIASSVRVAPKSEKLSAFATFAQYAAGMEEDDRFPRQQIIDRVYATASVHRLIETYGEDIILKEIANAFDDPLFPEDVADFVFNSDADGAEKTATENDIHPPELTDEALALRFAERHRDELRYVAAWSKWLIFDGKRWQLDQTLQAFDWARKVCREAAAHCDSKKYVKVLASAKTVAAVERLAKADRRLAATVDQWDANPWLLNTPGGVTDLRTGNLRSHHPSDYLTQITAVSSSGSCPTWQAFLDRVTAGDKSLKKFLQRMAGYCLTGVTNEHALFFGYGTGANGKSVFTSTISGILADYHCTAPIETFTASHHDRHPTELARLRGARLVTSVETEEGRRWAESRIKQLTGGDKIAAHFMRQDFFEFTAQFKLFITGNHKPGLRSVDEAIRRRLNLIPFTVTVPPAERDPDLTEKLKAEWPGVLAWMIEGCLAWQRDGLAPPATVTSATAAYLEAEDAVAAWLKEQCEEESEAVERSSTLFASWKVWAERAGESVGSQKKLSQKLEDRGFKKSHDRRGSCFAGLRVLAACP